LGTPTEASWPGISKNKDFAMASYPHYDPQPMSLIVPRLDKDGINLMLKLLNYQYELRILAKEAMRHSYFSSLPPSIHELPHIVSVFSVPGVELVTNPGNRKASYDGDRRRSSLY
jgi:hypothetical protein